MFILYLPETHDFIVLKIKFYWFSRKRKYLKSFWIEKEKGFLPRNKNQISIKILIYDNKHQAMTSFFGRKVILNPGFYIQTNYYSGKRVKTKTHQGVQTLRELSSLNSFWKLLFENVLWQMKKEPKEKERMRPKKQWI